MIINWRWVYAYICRLNFVYCMDVTDLFNRIAVVGNRPEKKHSKRATCCRNVPIISLEQPLCDYANTVTFGVVFFHTNTGARALATLGKDTFEFIPIERFADVANNHLYEYCYLIAANDADGNAVPVRKRARYFSSYKQYDRTIFKMTEKIYKYKMKLK
jgi:hypothetical protein